MSTLAQIAKDELLGRLTHDQAEQARAVAPDGLVLAAATPGADRQVACAWCLEAAGWCDATGGPHLCEGHDEHVLAVADAIAAPEIWWRPAQPGETPGQLTPEAEAQR